MNPLFRIDFSISDSLKIVRKSVLIYETIIDRGILLQNSGAAGLHAGTGNGSFPVPFRIGEKT